MTRVLGFFGACVVLVFIWFFPLQAVGIEDGVVMIVKFVTHPNTASTWMPAWVPKLPEFLSREWGDRIEAFSRLIAPSLLMGSAGSAIIFFCSSMRRFFRYIRSRRRTTIRASAGR